MKRVDIGPGTLVRVRWQTSPLYELAALVRLGLSGERHPLVGRVGPQVHRALAHPDTAIVRALVPAQGRGPFPFVTPPPVLGSAGLDDELDRVAARTPAQTAIEFAEARRPIPPHLHELAAEGRLGGALASGLRALWRLLMPPGLWAEVERAGREEVALCGGRVGAAGLAATLGGLHPRVHWVGPGRMVLDKPVVSERTLADEDLVFIPMVLGGAEPLVALEDEVPAIAYAARRPARAGRARPAGARPAGETRDRVLARLGSERSTTELARDLDLPLTTVSSQLAVLHRGGLVSRRRDGRSVLYAALPVPAPPA